MPYKDKDGQKEASKERNEGVTRTIEGTTKKYRAAILALARRVATNATERARGVGFLAGRWE